MREQAAPQPLGDEGDACLSKNYECTLVRSVCTVLAMKSGERGEILRESTRKSLRILAPKCAKAGRDVRKTREVSERKTAAIRK